MARLFLGLALCDDLQKHCMTLLVVDWRILCYLWWSRGLYCRLACFGATSSSARAF